MRQTLSMVSLVATVILTSIGVARAAETVDPHELRRRKNTLIVGMTTLPKELDPVKFWRAHEFLIAQSVYQCLVRVSETGNLVGDLATRWDLSVDGKTLTFHLNPKSVFHDGRPVTAADVAWSLSRHFWSGTNSIVGSYLGQALGIKAEYSERNPPRNFRVLDPLTFQLVMPKPYPPISYVLSMPGLAIVPRGTRSFSQPIGSGPMTATRDEKDDSWLLREFTGFTGFPPQTKTLRLNVVKDAEAARKAAASGEIDVAFGLPVDAAEGRWPDVFRVTGADSLAFLHLFFNAERAAFADAGLRKDLSALLQTLARSEKLPSCLEYQPHFLPRGILPHWYYERPRREMSAGTFRDKWSPGKSSATITIALRVDWFGPRLVTALQDTLRDAGYKVVIRRLGPDDYIKALQDNDYDLISGAYIGTLPDPDGFLDPLRPDSRIRMGRMPTQDMLARLDTIRHLRDPAKRLEGYARQLKDFESAMYFIPLFRLKVPILLHRRVFMHDSTFRFESELWRFSWEG